jgi:catechol 2,3-dioxygenase
MDASDASARPTFASRTPVHIGAVGLIVRDLDRVAAFYRETIGLAELERSETRARLGAGGVALVALEERRNAAPDQAGAAGLYHTAFLMPTRTDLARWFLNARGARVPITGASNHSVSEAIYLDDPEGNGVEVYADTEPQRWCWSGGDVTMATEPLDLDDLVRAADGGTYSGAPAGLRIGHIHLRVGDLAMAEKFYRDAIGLDVTRRRTGAVFLSSGRYHHHVAVNIWQSRGAGRRDDDRAGLAWFSLEASDGATLEALGARLRGSGVELVTAARSIEARDPWGTRVRLAQA